MCVLSSPVNINGFKQPESDPGPEQNHVIAEDHDANEESSPQNNSLSRVGIFCLHTKRSLANETDDRSAIIIKNKIKIQNKK